MLTRRRMASLAASSAFAPALAVPASGAPGSFDGFLRGVRAEAQRSGISPAILQQALSGLLPNARVIELDRKQPEFTMTWERGPRPDRVAAADRRRAGRGTAQSGGCCKRSRAGSASIAASSRNLGASNPITARRRAASTSSRRWRPWPGKAGARASSAPSSWTVCEFSTAATSPRRA